MFVLIALLPFFVVGGLVYLIVRPRRKPVSPTTMTQTAQPTNSGRSGMLGRVLALGFLVFLIWTGYENYNRRKLGGLSSPASSVTEPDPKVVAMHATSITKFRWYKDGFGTVMKATFTIRNDGERDVKDIEIKCVHNAPSGTIIDSNTRTIYEIVPAHKSRTFREFDMGFIDSQASGSDCEIADLALR